MERETNKKVDLIKIRNPLLVWVTLFTPLSMDKGQLIFLSHLGMPIHCPPGSLDVFSFLLAGSGYVPALLQQSLLWRLELEPADP